MPWGLFYLNSKEISLVTPSRPWMTPLLEWIWMNLEKHSGKQGNFCFIDKYFVYRKIFFFAKTWKPQMGNSANQTNGPKWRHFRESRKKIASPQIKSPATKIKICADDGVWRTCLDRPPLCGAGAGVGTLIGHHTPWDLSWTSSISQQLAVCFRWSRSLSRTKSCWQ